MRAVPAIGKLNYVLGIRRGSGKLAGLYDDYGIYDLMNW